MEIFGLQIEKKKPPATQASIVAPDDDGALDTIVRSGAAAFGAYLT